MFRILALTTSPGLTLAAPLPAETCTHPDAARSGVFLETLAGTAPDLESLALQDSECLAADEFSRDEALAKVMACLGSDRAMIDPATAKVVLSIRAGFGDYDTARGGLACSGWWRCVALPDAGAVKAATMTECRAVDSLPLCMPLCLISGKPPSRRGGRRRARVFPSPGLGFTPDR